MSVTVIIPTLNAGPQLRRLLQALREQTVPHELLIIDSSSSDDTIGIARSFGARTIVIKPEDFDHGGARSRAASHAGGELLVFLTQDVVPANERALEHLIKPLEDKAVAAVYGRQLSNPDATLFAAHLRLFKYPDRPCVKSAKDKALHGIETPFLSDNFCAYRAGALREIGLFRHGIIFAEDVYAGAKFILAGHSIVYAAGALVYHSHNHTMLEEFRRYFDTAVFYETEAWIKKAFGGNRGEAWRYLKSEFSYLWKHGNSFTLLEFFPRTALRVLGFGLGRCHRLLPGALCGMLSAQPGWRGWSEGRRAHGA